MTVKVVVEYKHILIYEKRNSVPTKILPLHVCSVRPISHKRFRICCAPNTLLECRVSSNKLMREWVVTIQDGIARRLSEQAGYKTHCGMELLAALQRANEANRFCADCHAPDPKWISISIGCIICIECSGVHRHLGTTISKVKSFELDMWDEKTEVIEKIGNADVNTIYEANIFQHHHEKPSAASEREVRERYIYNKYVCKLYKGKPSVVCPIINTQNKKKKSSVQILPTNERYPTHNRNGSQKPPIHIGSDVFSPQISHMFSTKYNPLRQGSFAFDPTRRGSLATSYVGSDNHRKVSQRRHSLHQSRL